MTRIVPPGIDPAAFPRRILLAVTGLSPQVVTETLYALGVSPAAGQPRFIATEIHLLTTTQGARLARTALLHPNGGQFHAMLSEYPCLKRPIFTSDTIHLIRDSKGRPLSDIRTPEENASAADTITGLLAQLTHDPDTALHVSIAGGRKTMGFYLGYAFSLFARPQDHLSHVLVSAPFESHPDFFYPPAIPRRLATRDGQYIDTADAVVTLAHIPVVRLRHGQPRDLLNGQASFIDTVSAIQKSLDPPQLHIELGTHRVRCGDTPVQLAPALVTWFAWWATQVLENRGAQSWRTADTPLYLGLYKAVVGRDAVAYERTEARLREGMEKSFFDENTSKLQRQLRRQLGMAAAPYLLASTGKRPDTRHQLTMPASAISITP